MKQKFNKIAVIVLASIVFFVGAGVTVINFCCSGCIQDFVSVDNDHNSSAMLCNESAPSPKESDSCCMEMETSDEDSTCNTDNQQESDKHCSAERISTDIDRSHTHTLQLNIPFVWSVSSHKNTEAKLANISSPKTEENHKTPISKLPREYLSLIRVLII